MSTDAESIRRRPVKGGFKVIVLISVALANLEIEVTGTELLSEMYGVNLLWPGNNETPAMDLGL
jgi:hypothetical protein